MAENNITLAIFDFDGTLTEGHLWSGIARHHRKHKVKRMMLYYYLFSHLPFWVAAKARLYSDEKDRSKWGEDLSILIKGFTVSEAHQAFAWVTDNYFLPLMRPDILKVLEEHKKQGHKIMLLSGMFDAFLEVIGTRIGTDYVIGTRLEINNNLYSGRIIKPLCFGKNKARLLVEFIEQRKLQVDFPTSTAYADSIYDIPVLSLTGNPVATYPDKKLYQIARSKNWQIIG